MKERKSLSWSVLHNKIPYTYCNISVFAAENNSKINRLISFNYLSNIRLNIKI